MTRKVPYIFDHRYDEYKDRSGEVYDAKVLMDDVLSYAPPVLSLLFLGGTFLVALLAYIDRDNKRK